MKPIYGTTYLRSYFSLKHNKGLRELVVFLSFLIFYKISRYIAIGDEETAFINAYNLVEFEKWLGIFREVSIQKFFIGETNFMRFINKFYMVVHLPSTIIFFMWLYHKKSDYYKLIRNGFLLANTITIFFYVSFPCAPPRMLNDLGFVDTLLKVSDINLYSGFFSGLFNQYAAVPSMHFGNALLIGLSTITLSKNKFIKWSILIYPIFVLFVIVVTGNHFFLDAIIGGIIVIIPYPIIRLRYKTLSLIRVMIPILKKQ
jgi:hypothetical protein